MWLRDPPLSGKAATWHGGNLFCMVQELAGVAEWVAPCAGMFLWLRVLQPPRDESALVAAMRRHKVVVVPGAPRSGVPLPLVT